MLARPLVAMQSSLRLAETDITVRVFSFLLIRFSSGFFERLFLENGLPNFHSTLGRAPA